MERLLTAIKDTRCIKRIQKRTKSSKSFFSVLVHNLLFSPLASNRLIRRIIAWQLAFLLLIPFAFLVRKGIECIIRLLF